MIEAVVNYQGDPKYKKLFEAAIADMCVVLSNPRFLKILEEEVTESKGNSPTLPGELGPYRSMSSGAIFDQLFIDGKLRLNIRTYYTPQRVIGYGVASDDWINVNTKYLKSYTIDDPYDRKEVGSNLGHEEYHNRGMSHDFKNTARRKHSVAYIFNRAYERAYDEIIIGNLPVTPKPAPKVYKKPWWAFW